MSHDFSGIGNFYISFSQKKYKNDDVIYAGVCTKQACYLTHGVKKIQSTLLLEHSRMMRLFTKIRHKKHILTHILK